MRTAVALRRHIIERLVAERAVRDQQHIVVLRDKKRRIRGHPRQQRTVRVRDLDDDRVSHDILLRSRVQPNLLDEALEGARAERIDGESHALPDLDLGDVGFSDRRLDLHLGQIARDGEQYRRVERRGDGLPDVDEAADDHPRHRRADDGIADIGAILLDLRFGGSDLRARTFRRLYAGLIVLAADILLFEQLPGASRVRRLQRLRRADVGERRFARRQPCGIHRRVEFEQQLPGLHLVVEVDGEFLHCARDLRANADDANRIDNAVCGDRLGQVTASYRRGLVRRRGVGLVAAAP